jgi:preprotein translocase subunit Sss1
MKIGRGWEKKGLVSLKLTHYLEGRKQLSFKIAMLSTSRARQRTTKVTNQILAKPSSNRPKSRARQRTTKLQIKYLQSLAQIVQIKSQARQRIHRADQRVLERVLKPDVHEYVAWLDVVGTEVRPITGLTSSICTDG